MKLTITISMDNAAFEDVQGDECANILRKLADTIDGDSRLDGFDTVLMDSNGNKVGKAKVTR